MNYIMRNNVILFFLLHTVSVNPFSLKRSKKENQWTKYILESARTENWNSAKYYRKIYISGKDQRFPEGDLDKSQLEEIKSNMEKLNRLNYLENDRISSMDKIERIRSYERESNGTITGYNIGSGGLMNDWDWDFV